MRYIDTHAHLDLEEFDADREAVVARARHAGVEALLCVAVSADSSRAAIALAQQYLEIHAAVGIQPNYCGAAARGDWDQIVAMAEHRRVAAVGETGLDRHWDFTPLEVQRDYFERHLLLARQCELPVVIHCRDAEADLMAMLREAAAQEPLRGVVHAFSADAATATECVELGLHVSFAGMVTYRNKKFRELRDVAGTVPADRLLIETDSPYLTPEPLRGKQKRNEPAHVALVAECLAELRGVSVEELSEQTTANARRLFFW